MRQRFCAFLLMTQMLPAAALFASEDRLTHTARAAGLTAATNVVCRIVSRAPDQSASVGSRMLPICIQGLPANLCAGSTPWPGSSPVDVYSVARCEEGDCVLDAASSESRDDCTGLTIQPRQPQNTDARR